MKNNEISLLYSILPRKYHILLTPLRLNYSKYQPLGGFVYLQTQIIHGKTKRPGRLTSQEVTEDLAEPLTLPEDTPDTLAVALTTDAAFGLDAVAALVFVTPVEDLQQVPVLETVDDVNSAPAIPSIPSVPSSPATSPSIFPSILPTCFTSSCMASCSCG